MDRKYLLASNLELRNHLRFLAAGLLLTSLLGTPLIGCSGTNAVSGAGGGTTGGGGGGGTTGSGGGAGNPLPTRTDWTYIGAKVDAGDENYTYPPYLAYDSTRNQVFLSVPPNNVVKVFDTQTHQQKAEISIPSPYGIDISADGQSVYVGTGTQFLYVLDPSTLHVKQVLDSANALPGGFNSINVFALNNGSLFIMGEGIDGGGAPILWYLSSGTASVVTAPVDGAITRSGDRSSILLASPFTTGNVAVYNVATKTFIQTPYPNGDIVERVAANPQKDQFAVSDLDGNISIFSSSLSLLGQIRIEPPNQIGGPRLNGMVFSGDGSSLYLFVDSDVQQYETGTFTQQAVMAQPYSLGYFSGPLPLVADSSGLIFGINEEGLDFIDVSKMKNAGLASSEFSYGMDYLSPNTGPVTGGTSISSTVTKYPTGTTSLNSAYIGPYQVGNFTSSSGQYSFSTPASSTTGAQNLIVVTSDSTPLLAPKAFSYGPDVVRLVSTTSGADGGGSGFLAGYGLGDTAADLHVTIGGQNAPVTKISSALSDLDPFPTPIRSATFTIPKGITGPADITLTTSAGTKTLQGGFQYNSPTVLHSTTSALEAGVYDPTRKALYYTSTNQILTWSVTGNAWLAPVSVPNSSSAALTGISISPNGQYLAAADQGNRSIIVYNPDNAAAIKSFPVSDGGFGLEPGSVAVSDQGMVYFNLAFTYHGGWGTRCQQDLVWVLDATTGATTDLEPSASENTFCMSIADRVLLSADANTVYIDDEGGLAAYDVPSRKWTIYLGAERANSDMAISGDNSRTVATNYLMDWNRGYLGTPSWSDLDLSDNQTIVMGQKLDRNGTILFQPWSQALDVVDLSHLVKQQRIALPYPVQSVFDTLVWDDDNDTAYVIVNGGLLEVPVAPPLILQSATPSGGSVGTAVTLKGSGLSNGDTLTVDGLSVSLNVIDEHTATFLAPPHADGAVVITVNSPKTKTSSLDPGFVYGIGPPHSSERISSISRLARRPATSIR